MYDSCMRLFLREHIAACTRYQEAQEILFGADLDLATRFNMTDDKEKGTILLDRIFSIYQERLRASGFAS